MGKLQRCLVISAVALGVVAMIADWSLFHQGQSIFWISLMTCLAVLVATLTTDSVTLTLFAAFMLFDVAFMIILIFGKTQTQIALTCAAYGILEFFLFMCFAGVYIGKTRKPETC